MGEAKVRCSCGGYVEASILSDGESWGGTCNGCGYPRLLRGPRPDPRRRREGALPLASVALVLCVPVALAWWVSSVDPSPPDPIVFATHAARSYADAYTAKHGELVREVRCNRPGAPGDPIPCAMRTESGAEVGLICMAECVELPGGAP